jgi:hypothetical protein
LEIEKGLFAKYFKINFADKKKSVSFALRFERGGKKIENRD